MPLTLKRGLIASRGGEDGDALRDCGMVLHTRDRSRRPRIAAVKDNDSVAGARAVRQINEFPQGESLVPPPSGIRSIDKPAS